MKVAVTDDIDTCLTLRRTVFIDEQAVPEAEEIDGLDEKAIHLLATDQGTPIGCARILIHDSTGKIGRVCVLKSHRGSGAGAALIRAALAHLKTIPGITTAKLGAQTQALAFYEKLGFTAHGPEFLDAGIPHRMMTRTL